MAAVGPSLCGIVGDYAIGPLGQPQACVLARSHLTGRCITLVFTERWPVWAWSYFLIVKCWYISTLLSSGLKA